MAAETPDGDGHRLVGAVLHVVDRRLHLLGRLADQRGHHADDARVLRRLGPRQEDLLLRGVRHQHGAVAVDDLAARGGDADHPHLVAGHGGGVGLAVDHLERPQAQHQHAEEHEHDDPDDAQTQARARLLFLGRTDEGGDVDALARPHPRLAGVAAPRRAARRRVDGLGMEPVASDRVAERALHQIRLSAWAGTSERRLFSPASAQRIRRLTGSTSTRLETAHHQDEGQEVDLHHLLLSEDGAEHGEQHVRCDAPRDRGHRLEPGRPGVDGRRERPDGEAQQAADQGRQPEGGRQDEVEGQPGPESDDGARSRARRAGRP